jgi:hypothetical protein
MHCPNSDLICARQGIWLEQSLFLARGRTWDDIARSLVKNP